MNSNQLDIVIVVLDCVRSEDFPVAPAKGNPESDGFAQLLREAVTFRNAVAPASWTVPSHISLLSGKYPWEQSDRGKHLRAIEHLGPLLQERLVALGYRSLLLSGNPTLAGVTNFSKGFERTRIAEGWEPWVKSLDLTSDLEADRSTRAKAAVFLVEALQGKSAVAPLRELLMRYPFTLDILNRLLSKLSGRVERPNRTSRWIEDEFERFLKRVPTNQRLFAVVNYCDAHEPYLTDPTRRLSIGEWWSRVRVSQQASAVLTGGRLPSVLEGRILRRLYLETILELQTRVGELISALIRSRRWSNTLFILTSDHGQEFLEDGHLFHGFVVDDEVSRIPLLVRNPITTSGSAKREEWVSLVDILPTVLSAVGTPPPRDLPGIPLLESSTNLAGRTVFSVSEGIIDKALALRWLGKDGFERLNTFKVAGYRGNSKITIEGNPDSTKKMIRLVEGITGSRDSTLDSRARSELRTEVSRRYMQFLRAGSTKNTLDESADNRIESWGYV